MHKHVSLCIYYVLNYYTGSRWFTWVARDGCGINKALSITYAQKLKCNSVRSLKILKNWGNLDLETKYNSKWMEEYNDIFDRTLSLHDLKCIVRENKHGIGSFPDLNTQTIKNQLHGIMCLYASLCIIM